MAIRRLRKSLSSGGCSGCRGRRYTGMRWNQDLGTTRRAPVGAVPGRSRRPVGRLARARPPSHYDAARPQATPVRAQLRSALAGSHTADIRTYFRTSAMIGCAAGRWRGVGGGLREASACRRWSACARPLVRPTHCGQGPPTALAHRGGRLRLEPGDLPSHRVRAENSQKSSRTES